MRAVTRALTATTMAVVVMATAACGQQDGDDDPSESSQTPSARAVSGGEASDYILPEGDLPSQWRYATGEQHLGVPRMCDVVLEPPNLESADTQRFTQGFAGPFVIQYSFVAADEESAAEAPDALAAKIDECRESVYDDTTVSVEPLPGVEEVGTGFAAARLIDPNREESPEQQWITFRNGTHVTVMIAYTLSPRMASAADLNAMAAAINELG